MDDFFFAKLDDLLAKSERGSVACSRFLDPAEQYHAKTYLKRLGISPSRYAFCGGYADAERVMFFALPEWCTDVQDAASDALCAIEMTGSGFRTLSHPQYLGSLLALGMERESVGDIVLLDACHAVCFVTHAMGEFLLCEHEKMRVASDTVKLNRYTVKEGFCADRKIEVLTDTIPSARIDCVVASLLRTSRAKAQQALTQKQVKLNFSEVTDYDIEVCPGDTVSIHKAGRFVITACSEKTKKDRIRLVAEHLVS